MKRPRLPLSRLRLCLASLAVPPLLTLGGSQSQAATLYWDGQSTGPDADGGSGSWTQGIFTANWDTSATGGSDTYWNGGEDAVFGGTGGSVTFNGSEPVAVKSITFTAPGYTIHSLPRKLGVLSGMKIDTGIYDATIVANIVNSPDLRKIGTGTLTFHAGDEFYAGIITIEQGTVKPWGYEPFGSTNADTHVWPGARIDTSGKSLGRERIRIQGSGPDGKGVLVNNGSNASDTLHDLVLSAPATIGGDFNWEMGTNSDFQTTSIQMGLHTLTKSGPSNINLWSTTFTSPGHIDLKEGSLSFWKSTFLGGSASNVLTIRSGAELRQLTNDREQPWTLQIEDGGSWDGAANGANSWKGPITLLGGAAIFDSNGSSSGVLPSMRVLGVISGPGSLVKSGGGTYILSAANTYSGGTTVNGGTLVLNAAGAVRGAMTVNTGGTLQLPLTDSLGTDPATRVSEVTLSGGTLDITATATPSIPLLKIGPGTLRSNGGVTDPLAANYYVLGNDTAIQVTGDGGAVISGRLHLGTGNTGNRALIDLPASATDGLRIDAAITSDQADAGITKTGSGRMVLNGPVHYSGETRVAAGSLLVGTLGDTKQSPVRVHGGGSFGTTIPGKTISAITAEDDATLILPVVTGGTTVVSGTLDLTGGSIAIAPVLGGDLVVGTTYDLLTADSITGSGVPVLDMSGAFGPSSATGTLAVNGNKIQFTLTGTGANLVWTNASAGESADGTWDTTLTNFSDGVSAVPFRAFDSVTFDDSVAPGSAKTITLGTALAPLRVTVANSDGDYSFAPPGALASLGSLVKTGSSKLTLAGSDHFTLGGSITAGGGVLDLSGRTVRAAGLTLSAGQFNNASASFDTLDLRSGSSNANLTAPGPLTKTTTGTVTLTGTNNLSGPCTIAAGHLVIGNSQAPTATFGSGPIMIAAGARFTYFRYEATTTIPNAISGGGELTLSGANAGNSFCIFTLPGDTSGFTGPITVSSARISSDTFNKLDRGGRIAVVGRGVVELKNRILPNAITLQGNGGWGPSSDNLGNLRLDNVTLTGPITLGPSSVNLVTGPTSGTRHSIISGPISPVGTSPFGQGGMSFSGSNNTFTLSGASTYTGATTVAADTTLNLTGSLGDTTVTVNSTGAIGGGGSIGINTSANSFGTLNLSNQSTLRAVGGATPLRVRGNVNLGTAVRVMFEPVEAVLAGPVPILEYTGTLSGTAAQLLLSYSSSYHRKAVFAIVPGAITLDIGARELTWTGADAAVWGQGPLNWTSSAGPDSFHRGDCVIFPERGPGVWRVNSDGDSPVPCGVTVNNETTEYRIATPISGACSFVKNGAGKLALAFPSTYTGGTTVNGGLLEASFASLGTGPVLVAASATLAGNALIPGTATIHGTVNPGTPNQTTTATLQLGPTTLAGSYLCQLAASSCDRLTITGDLDLTGSTLTLQPTYGASSTAATYIIASYTGTLTGNFATVSGMPAGYVLKHLPELKRLVVTRVTLADWAATYPGLADMTAAGDPDGDGLPNLVEYALAGNPGLADPAVLPNQTLTANSLIFRYKRNDPSKFNTTQTVQWTTDPASWNNNIPVTLDNSPGVEITLNGDEPDDITVTIPRAPGQMFARLKVTEP